MNGNITLENQFGAHNYHPLEVVLTKGQGIYVWDAAGRQYTDMMSAYSAVSHGHCHAKLLAALTEQAHALTIVSRAFYTDKLGNFLKKLCDVTGLDAALPMNTGAEAVETALKAARKWGYTKKNVPADQAEIIICHGNFHGRTIAVVGMSSEAQYRDGFGPFPKGFVQVPYGDIDALKKAITANTVAFLIEPIQGENGIVVPPVGYLKACERICQENNVLLICDEIQTGMGRTGKFLACEHEDVKSDGLVLGKALGGGLLPVSVFLTRKDVMDVFHPGDHGSTFGGNPLASAVGLRAIELLFEEGLIANAEQLGNYLQAELKKLQVQYPQIIHEVRGRGLMVGVEINKRIPARTICKKLLLEGVLTKETHHTVVRLAPPLVITLTQMDKVLAAIGKVIAEVAVELEKEST